MFTRAWLLVVGVLFVAALALAQETTPQPAGGKTPLGVRQQRVEQMTEELERRFTQLIQTLSQTEPERAKKLQEALNEAKKLQLIDRMGAIVQALDGAKLDSASDNQKAVLADIRALLALLLDEKSDRDKAREEYERLMQWKRDIEAIIQAEKGEKREADKIAAKDKTLASLQAKIKAMEALIEQEKQVIAATEAARTQGIQALGKIAGQQEQVRQATEKLADEIAKEAGDVPPKESSPADDKQPGGEAPPGEPKPSEGGKSGEGSKGEKGSKGGDGSKSGEGARPSEGSPAEGAPQSSSPQRPLEPGEKPLRAAAQNQKQAEGNLQEGKGKAAEQDEKSALDNLQKALAELKKEQQRIASLPPEHLEKLAKKQDDLSQKAGDVTQKMQDAAKQGGSGGEKGDSSPGGSGGQPGQKKVAQAQKHMQQAGGGLRKQDPEDASREEHKAIKELEEAIREIEERLAQLREETQLEKLARLERRFTEMLAIQKGLSAETEAYAQKTQSPGAGDLTRPEKIKVRSIGDEERRMDAVTIGENKKPKGLAGQAQEALDILIDDGTSVVFPDVVQQVRDDLITVGGLLDEVRLDSYTLSMQKEIETTLEELIEALKQAQQQKESTGGGGGGGGGDPPLLPNSAELKLLRAAQLRVNRRTQALDASRPEGADFDATQKGELGKTALRQAEIAEMTQKILERIEQEP